MKKLMTCLAGLALAAGIFGLSNSQAEPPATPAAAPATTKIGFVNIAKVLREYQRANAKGQEIADKRKIYLDQINAIRTKVSELQKQGAPSVVPEQQAKIKADITAYNRQIQDIDEKAQAELTALSRTVIASVHADIKQVISSVAQHYSLDCVLVYPDASSEEEKKSPELAQVMLQAPALVPFYAKASMDQTAVVISTLNSHFPPPAGYKPTEGGSPITPKTATPGGNVTQTGGTK